MGNVKQNDVSTCEPSTDGVTGGRRAETVRRRMAATRAQILDEARRIITGGGVSALTARSLARASSVSLSTLYSLVGKREEVLSALFAQSQDRVRARIDAHGPVTGLDRVELLANEAAALFGEDEVYYRAAQLAMEHLDEAAAPPAAVATAYRWGAAMIGEGLRQCADAGLLRGVMPVATLEDYLVQAYRAAYRRWGYGQLSIAEVRATTLAQSYVVLAADAADALRATIDERMARLAAAPIS